MRPISLELKGFTSFRETARVDFSSLDLFAITGPTGAGKTSILDAIIFALYGRTPRIGEKNIGDLISQGAERLQVLLEFSAAQKNYRLARTVKKTAKSVSSSRRLEIQREAEEDWEPLADGANEVRDKVKEIVGLEFDGFIKSVVLPQGEFDTFLNGKPPERRQILQDLLKLDVYLKMARRAREIAEQA